MVALDGYTNPVDPDPEGAAATSNGSRCCSSMHASSARTLPPPKAVPSIPTRRVRSVGHYKYLDLEALYMGRRLEGR